LQTITVLPNKFGCLRHTIGYVLETVADIVSRFAFKLINRYKVSISRKAESDFIYMIEFARLAVVSISLLSSLRTISLNVNTNYVKY